MDSAELAEEEGIFGIMSDSLDELIADYFETRSVVQKRNSIVTSTTTGTNDHASRSRPISNFNLGEADLFDIEDSFTNQTQMTTISSPEGLKVSEKKPEEEDKKSRIVSIRTSRKSISYNIVFNPAPRSRSSLNQSAYENETALPEISIRIHAGNSRRVKAGGESCSKDNSVGQVSSSRAASTWNAAYVQELEKMVSTLKNENAELEKVVEDLKGKLGKANDTIGLLEIEASNFYMQ